MNRRAVAALVWVMVLGAKAQHLEPAKQATISGTVVDAETGNPLPRFRMIPGKMHFLRDLPLRWDRDNSFAAFDGKFIFRFSDEDITGDFGLAIEAPGYLPSASPRYTNAGNYSFNFTLTKGEGIRGVAEGPDGKPMGSLKVYLVDPSERLYMRTEAGQIDEPFSRNVSSAVSDADGCFVFEPRLEANTIIAAHDLGYTEVPAEQVIKTGKLTLQPWGAVKGVLRVGGKVATNHFVSLYSMEYPYGDGTRFWPPLDLRLIMRPNESGKFAFPQVPPGERRVWLQYADGDGPVPRSHGFAINVKPGKTSQVTIGWSGYQVTGKIISKVPVDWERDMQRGTQHSFIRRHPDEPSSSKFAAIRGFWTSETGRAFQREPFQFVPVFHPDGSFEIDDVPPGEYRLSVRATDPSLTRSNENFLIAKPIGELRTNVIVRNSPLDLGILELKVQRP